MRQGISSKSVYFVEIEMRVEITSISLVFTLTQYGRPLWQSFLAPGLLQIGQTQFHFTAAAPNRSSYH